MSQGQYNFAKFVNTIDKTDLYSCLALWMEECPLATPATTVMCGFDLELNDNCDDLNINSINNEGTWSDAPEEDGPLKKRSKTNNCITTDKIISRNSDISVRDQTSLVLNNLVNGTTNAINNVTDSKEESLKRCETSVDRFINRKPTNEQAKSVNCNSPTVNKIGVVMVDISSENIVAIDCSRDNVHGVASVLVDFSDRASNCVIYASRKPCSVCTKLMIQAGISRVCYLPFEPEYPNDDDLDKVEKLYRMSEIGQSIHVPNIQKIVLAESELRYSPYSASKHCHVTFMLSLLGRYWGEQWKSRVSKQLKWPEYSECKKQVDHSIEVMLEWISRVTFGDLPEAVTFYECNYKNSTKTETSCGRMHNILPDDEHNIILPLSSNPRWQELARHMSRMANILAQCSNDPKRGVGAVILQRNQIVSACWNGYPPKAGYGDFPRASHCDGPLPSKKYPFSIHAEQAAILGRNTRNISDVSCTMFVSKTPCNECVPLIIKAGIKNVVFPLDTQKRDPAFLGYSLIWRSIDHGRLRGFESRLPPVKQEECESDSKSVNHASRQLCFNGRTKSVENDAAQELVASMMPCDQWS